MFTEAIIFIVLFFGLAALGAAEDTACMKKRIRDNVDDK